MDDNQKPKPLIDHDLWAPFWFALAVAWIVAVVFFQFDGDDEAIRNYVLSLGAVLAPFAFWLSYRRTKAVEEQNQLTQASLQRQSASEQKNRLTSSFANSIDQLGSEHLHVRAGALHTLSSISREDPDEFEFAALSIIASFLRDRAREESASLRKNYEFMLSLKEPWGKSNYRTPIDIESAFIILEDISHRSTDPNILIDLQGTDFLCLFGVARSISLHNTSFVNSVFEGLLTSKVEFKRSNLSNAQFSNCNLNKFSIYDSELLNTNFTDCNIKFEKIDNSELLMIEFSKCYIYFFGSVSSNISGCEFNSGALVPIIATEKLPVFRYSIFNDIAFFDNSPVGLLKLFKHSHWPSSSFYNCSSKNPGALKGEIQQGIDQVVPASQIFSAVKN